MNLTPYRAFGFTIIHVQFYAGERVFLDPVSDNVFPVGEHFPFVWLYTKGKDVLRNVATGELIERQAGDCTLSKPYPLGEWVTTLPEDLELFCVGANVNQDKLPLSQYLQEWHLPSGSQAELPRGTQLFLAAGSLDVASKVMTGPMQVAVKSGNKVVTATSDCHGFIINALR